MKRIIIACFVFLLLLPNILLAQNNDDEYTKVLQQRAGKIVETLSLTDLAVKDRVRDIIVCQYKNLSGIHDPYDEQVSQIKKSGVEKAVAEQQIANLTEKRDLDIFRLHNVYIGALSSELTLEQVDKVKDGMTFGVVQVTYGSYCDMIPTLKEEEKRQLYAWLVEAREYAMDAPSSKKKHEWFGKYKGRFNNYLSKQGYDTQKERTEWEQRLKENKK